MTSKNLLPTASLAVLCATLFATTVMAGELKILTWDGYADPSVIAPFESATGCKVSVTYVGSNDDFAPKLAAGGGGFDIVTPSIDVTKLLIDAGFVKPIDTAKITAWGDLYPKFTKAAGLIKDGKVYGVPYAWGAVPMMYLKDKFPTPPTSIADLWNPELKGRVSLWDDKSALYLAARSNGNTNIYKLTDKEIGAAKAKLTKQRPNIRKYWTTAEELVDLYKSGEVWISNTWGGYQSALLAAEGIAVVEFIPKEGAEGWLDSHMIVTGTRNEDCAYQFLNMSVSAEGQAGMFKINGYAATNPVAAKAFMTPEEFTALHQDDPALIDSLMLWENLGARLPAYTKAWNAVKAQ